MSLSSLIKIRTQKLKKRVGRGYGSGKGGHTIGKGTKGQKVRSGKGKPWMGFEGGQVPLYKRLPRINGFQRVFASKPVSLDIRRLAKVEAADTITPKVLLEQKIIKHLPKAGIKLIGNSKIKLKLKLQGFKFSEGARKALEQAGSTILE